MARKELLTLYVALLCVVLFALGMGGIIVGDAILPTAKTPTVATRTVEYKVKGTESEEPAPENREPSLGTSGVVAPGTASDAEIRAELTEEERLHE